MRGFIAIASHVIAEQTAGDMGRTPWDDRGIWQGFY